MISDGPYKEIKKNPLSKMIREPTKIMNNSKLIIEDKSKNFIKIRVSNPQVPKLYALPKIHKPRDSIRKIVSNIGALTYGLAKYLIKIFSSIQKFEFLSVKYNIELVNRLSNFDLKNNNKLISFDVVNLFPIKDDVKVVVEILIRC